MCVEEGRLERVELRARRRVDVLVEAELARTQSVCATAGGDFAAFSACASLKGRRHFAETQPSPPSASTRTRRSSGVASTTSTSASRARTATSRESAPGPRAVAPFGAATRKTLSTRDAAGLSPASVPRHRARSWTGRSF